MHEMYTVREKLHASMEEYGAKECSVFCPGSRDDFRDARTGICGVGEEYGWHVFVVSEWKIKEKQLDQRYLLCKCKGDSEYRCD